MSYGDGRSYLTPVEVAQMVGVTVQSIRLWIHKGSIPFIKVGGRYRIPKEAVESILNPHNAESTILN